MNLSFFTQDLAIGASVYDVSATDADKTHPFNIIAYFIVGGNEVSVSTSEILSQGSIAI